MTRYEDWPERLAAFLSEDKPFAWGQRDCCLFVCDAILAMTGVDVGAEFRGHYRTELGAARLIMRRGGVAGIAEEITERYGMREIMPSLAQRGDVGLVRCPAESLAVIGMTGYAVGTGPYGRVLVDRKQLIRAWRV